MMKNALSAVNLVTPSTNQMVKAREDQVKNNAGGFVFKVNDDDMFMRFLTIGSTGGTYYVGEKVLTDEQVKFVQRYIKDNQTKAIKTIIDVSTNARAPKNTQAIFALAVAFTVVDEIRKPQVKAAVPLVCRTATHLFEFAQFVENTSGWGRAKKSAVASWYTQKSADDLAYQSVKYRQRNGWTHRDALRLSHPKFASDAQTQATVNFMLGKPVDLDVAPEILSVFQRMQAATSITEVVNLISGSKRATWEMVPTQFLREPKVWRALFEKGMGQTALLRNVKRLNEIGLFSDMKFVAEYAAALSDKSAVEKGRMHPIQYLNALGALIDIGPNAYYYDSKPDINGKITAAIERGYELAFKNIEPANKRTLVALDVSGSMSSPAAGLNLSCAAVSGALSHIIAKSEPYSLFRGFTSGSRAHRWNDSALTDRWNDSALTDLGISESDSLGSVMKKISGQNFGGTDCALPMLWARDNSVEVDTFIVVTDNETWAGQVQPFEALKQYRKSSGINARLAVIAASGSEFTIADSSDSGMMDFSGMDSSGPKLLADFSAGRI